MTLHFNIAGTVSWGLQSDWCGFWVVSDTCKRDGEMEHITCVFCASVYLDSKEVPIVPLWCEEAAIAPCFLLVIISLKGQVLCIRQEKSLHSGSAAEQKPEEGSFKSLWSLTLHYLVCTNMYHFLLQRWSSLKGLSTTTSRRQSHALFPVGTKKVDFLFQVVNVTVAVLKVKFHALEVAVIHGPCR